MHKSLLSILVLSALVASTLVGCEGPSEQPCTLIVYSVIGGNVSVMEEDAGGWIEAEVGMSLEPGDTIRCSGGSNAEITFIEGTTIELETGTEIEVASLNYSADTGSATIRVKQTIGSIIFRVTKIIDPASCYEVETPTGVVAIRGSAAEVLVIADGTTWACNLEGDIWAAAKNRQRKIPKGRCAVIRPGQPPRLVCDLTISSSSGGRVPIPGEGTFSYDEGTVVNVRAEAELRYEFGGWTGDVSTIPDVHAAVTTITMNDNYSITAIFEEGTGPYYTLTIGGTDGGSTNPADGEHMYPAGAVVPITAIPDSGYEFVNWTGNVDTIADVNSPSTTISMMGNRSITANFRGIYYTLTMGIDGSGSTNPSVGQHSYIAGTVVPIMATPGTCYHFAYWTGDVGTIGNVNLSSTTIEMNGHYSITANFGGEIVTFPDPNLEAAVRSAIGIPTGPIYSSDLEELTSLSASSMNIADLTGLECATSLTFLSLGLNQISDISPLANLTNLTTLSLGYNQISNISPLANLTNLTSLYLGHNQISSISPLANLTNLTSSLNLEYNQISNISPLANLTNLTYLRLGHNQISNISPLASLTGLTTLWLEYNQISNTSPLASLTSLTKLVLQANQISGISALANLTNLTGLFLEYNQISDISPLVQNDGLATGDIVGLNYNPLSSDSINIYIPQLQARGVSVFY